MPYLVVRQKMISIYGVGLIRRQSYKNYAPGWIKSYIPKLLTENKPCSPPEGIDDRSEDAVMGSHLHNFFAQEV